MKYELNSPDVMAEKFDADLVLLNLRSGEYFNITGESRVFLDLVVEGVNPAALVEEITKFNADAGNAAGEFCQNLEKHNLIRQVSQTEADPVHGDHAQAVLDSGSTFSFECFDDLSDLLAADPIHDVAPQAGWPIMPN